MRSIPYLLVCWLCTVGMCGGCGDAPADGAGIPGELGDAGNHQGSPDGGAGDDAGSENDAPMSDGGGLADASPADAGTQGGGVVGVIIYANDDCTIATDPASITVSEGTSFTVSWTNHASSDVEVDVAKIDQYNQVPIIIGLPPANSYHDAVREWCGELFTGTFSFRITSCYEPYYLDVDCGG